MRVYEKPVMNIELFTTDSFCSGNCGDKISTLVTEPQNINCISTSSVEGVFNASSFKYDEDGNKIGCSYMATNLVTVDKQYYYQSSGFAACDMAEDGVLANSDKFKASTTSGSYALPLGTYLTWGGKHAGPISSELVTEIIAHS